MRVDDAPAEVPERRRRKDYVEHEEEHVFRSDTPLGTQSQADNVVDGSQRPPVVVGGAAIIFQDTEPNEELAGFDEEPRLTISLRSIIIVDSLANTHKIPFME